MTSEPAPIVWLLHDDRRGHQVQLKGLGNRLTALVKAQNYWIDCTAIKVPLWRVLLGLAPRLDVPEPFAKPDLIVGAGSQTHRLLAVLRRKRSAHTAVLMRPSFPRGWVNSRIIPAHDDVGEDQDTLITQGVLNTQTPMAHLTDKRHGLILVGGPSKHFEWNVEAVLEQIESLRQRYPQWRWTLSSSRRTPDKAIDALSRRAGPNVLFRDHRKTHANWLAHTLADCRAAWITPDSVSMVYEALTAGIPTGLFDLPAKPDSRVARGIETLRQAGRAGHIESPNEIMADDARRPEMLWEADRAARWLLERWRSTQ